MAAVDDNAAVTDRGVERVTERVRPGMVQQWQPPQHTWGADFRGVCGITHLPKGAIGAGRQLRAKGSSEDDGADDRLREIEAR